MSDEWKEYLPGSTHLWATVIPHRHPSFKTHTGIGQAKNAINAKYGDQYFCKAWLLQHNGSGWEVYHEVLPPVACAYCHQDASDWRQVHAGISPAYRNPIVCYNCYKSEFGYGSDKYKASLLTMPKYVELV